MIPQTKITDFEWQVYEITLSIPMGQTLSYKEVAQKIGRPLASRAVGQALKKNPFAPVIPCHRVVRSDGSLGGYQGTKGLTRKQILLDQEKEISTILDEQKR